MDVYSVLDGQSFVWDSNKATSNLSRHGVQFEQAREIFWMSWRVTKTPAPTKSRDR